MRAEDVTLNVRILLKGKGVPWWRARLVGWFARLLRVSLDVEGDRVTRGDEACSDYKMSHVEGVCARCGRSEFDHSKSAA